MEWGTKGEGGIQNKVCNPNMGCLHKVAINPQQKTPGVARNGRVGPQCIKLSPDPQKRHKSLETLGGTDDWD